MNGKYLYFAIAALCGVLAALVSFLPFLLTAAVYLYCLYKYKRFTKQQLTLIFVAIGLFFFIGQHAAENKKTNIPETTTTFYIEYTGQQKVDGNFVQIQAKDLRWRENILIRYKIPTEAEKELLTNQSFYSRLCKVSGAMEKPKIGKNPNGFDYRDYLANKGVFWMVEIDGNPLQNCSAMKRVSPIVVVKQLRYDGIRYLDKHFPSEIAALSAALIFGDRSMFDPEVLENYQNTGIVHLLAISGLHVSLLIGMVFYLGIRIGFTRQFMLNFLLLILPIYVILTGASPSVTRACLMVFLVLITVKWKRNLKLLPIDAISIAFICYILYSPLTIFDVGFQLSFSVSLAIIISARYILMRYQKTLARMLATSITAQLAALPFLLYHFFEMSLLGIAANLIYIPLFSYVFLPGLYILFLLQLLFSNAPLILIQFFMKIIILSNDLIAFISDFSFASFVPGRPHILMLIIYLILIGAGFYLWENKHVRKRQRWLVILTTALFTLQLTWNWLNPFGEITIIDVGQGDSILIHLPHGRGNYLIDTGGTINFSGEEWSERTKPFEVGRDVVVPFLKSKGITKIDKLILTHGDMDHIGGAFAVIKELKVKEILLPSVVEQSEAERGIIIEANKKRIPVVKASAGHHWQSKNSEFYILAPEKNFTGERNSGSIAIYAEFGGLSWFFGGDLDQEGEIKIINKYPALTIDVLKAGHHGSKTSSADAFIKRLNPSVALISAGEKNRFGHPHQEVLTRLKEKNALIYRTDFQGAITYRFYNNKGTFFTNLP